MQSRLKWNTHTQRVDLDFFFERDREDLCQKDQKLSCATPRLLTIERSKRAWGHRHGIQILEILPVPVQQCEEDWHYPLQKD